MVVLKKQHIANIENLANQQLDSLVQKNPGLSDKHRKQAYEAYKQYFHQLAKSHTVQESINKWVEVYLDKFSYTEIEELVRFQRTEIGRKSVQVSLSGNKKYFQYMINKNSASIKKAEPILNKKISSIIDEHLTESMSFVGKSILYILDVISPSGNTDN